MVSIYPAVIASNRTLRDAGATILGGVLNNVDIKRAKYNYYYYYAYHYPKYYRKENKREKRVQV